MASGREVYGVTAQLLWRHEAKNLRQTRTNHSILTWRRFFFARTRTESFVIRAKKISWREPNKNLRHSLEKFDWRKKLANTNTMRMRRFFFERRT